MTDLIKELRELAASEEVADRAADELERLQRENEELRKAEILLAIRTEELTALKRENEELRKQCDTLEFRAGDALDRAVRAEQENEEVMRQKAYQYQRAKKAEEKLAALKAQSTEQPVAEVTESSVYQLAESGKYYSTVLSDERLSVGAELYLYPPKQESTEPVFWAHPMDIARFPSVTLVKVSDEQIPLITQDQATALVEDFKRRAVEVCSEDPYAIGKHLVEAIESLPLIGEK